MRDSIRLGRIGGVKVGLHWSLLVVTFLLAAGLAQSRLPVDAPGSSQRSYLVAGVLTAAALLVSVLLHELGHAFVAVRAGMAVDGITLSWLGGITRIEGDSPRASVELAIAGVGPAISLCLGGGFAIVRHLVDASGGHRLIAASLGWLAVINVALAVFNLIPASPLDGGRVLHAAIWGIGGDRHRATRYASRAGIALGMILIAYGFSHFLTGRSFDGFVLVVLGAWILSSARAEELAGRVAALLEPLTVAELMRPVGAAPGWVTLRSFISDHDSPRPGWVWLLESWGAAGYSGVVAGETLRLVPPQRWDLVRPCDLATPVDQVSPARPGEPVLDALRRSNGNQMLLVIEGGRTVGAVLPADVQALVRAGGTRRSTQTPLLGVVPPVE